MKNILVINGHQKYPFADGRLNQTIFENIVEFLSMHYDVKTTVIHKGYLVEEEQEKFQWADAIVFQSPMFWYSIPGAFKTYIDKVYSHGIFFDAAVDKYGSGGLFNGKKYMFSLTLNTPEETFGNPDSFLEGRSLDETIFHLHKTQQYCGMEPLKTFAVYDVIKNPLILQYLDNLKKHIKEVFQV